MKETKPIPTPEQRERFVESLAALHRTGVELFGEIPTYPLLVYRAAIEAGSEDLAELLDVLKKYVVDTCQRKGIQ